MPFGPEFPAVSVFWSTSSCFSSIACEFRQQQPGAADWAKPPQAAEGDSVCSLCNYLPGMSDAAMILAVCKQAVSENIDAVMEKQKEIIPELFFSALRLGLGIWHGSSLVLVHGEVPVRERWGVHGLRKGTSCPKLFNQVLIS